MYLSNFTTHGCENCQKKGQECSLVNGSNGNVSSNETAALSRETSVKIEDLGGASVAAAGYERVEGYLDALRATPEEVTPQYLKKAFGFNLSLILDELYQYLLYGHPKAVIESRLEEDVTKYHESGVIVLELKEEELPASKQSQLRHFKSWAHFQFLLQIHAFTLSSRRFHFKTAEIKKLVEIYFFKINGIFPIICEEEFWNLFSAGTEPSIIVFAMILLILRDKLAENVFRQVFARVQNSSGNDERFYMDLESFIDELNFKIRQLYLILNDLGDYNKINRLVTMLLLSLHHRYDRLGGEQSSHDLTCGINLAFALAIHMKPTKKFYTKEKAAYLSDLWWTCYIMDRFNSVTNFKCFFIKHEDFNLDLPYENLNLLQLVQLAKSFENMLVALYQPFNNVHMKDQNNDLQSRLRIFNAADFQDLEFDLCSQEIASDSMNFIEIQGIDDLQPLKAKYVEDTIRLLSRLINNTIILVSQKGFFNDPAIHNLVPKKSILRASGNVLWYMKKIPENLVLQAPILIFCLLLSMSCGLKMRARNVLGTNDRELEDVKPSFEIEGYMLELEKFRKGWWIVDDVYKLSKDFIEQLKETEKKRKDIELSIQNRDEHNTHQLQAGELRSANSSASIQNILQVAAQDSIDPFSVDGSNFFSGWDLSKIAQYDNFFENMQDDLLSIDMFSM